MLLYSMNEVYDVIILGAGINGVAAAKALAETGKSVVVIEKSHIGAGASSHSSRLIHGGLRYLEHMEFSLVKEALGDQKYLLDTYPELVRLRPFYLPMYQDSARPVWMIKLGLWIYSLFARHGLQAEEVSMEEFSRLFPRIRTERLKAVFKYYDGKTNDLALTQRVAEEAKALGVEIIECQAPQSVDVNEDVIRVSLEDRELQSHLLINATGAWVDEVNTAFSLPSRYRIEKLSGIHLVIDRVLVPEPLFLQTDESRIFFIIPEEKTTLIGTTERREELPIDEVKVNNEDIEYLLAKSSVYLKTPLRRSDIKEVFIGVRPIIKSAKDPTKMSREYKLDLHEQGKNHIVHIYGGKLTTFPSLAAKVADILKDYFR